MAALDAEIQRRIDSEIKIQRETQLAQRAEDARRCASTDKANAGVPGGYRTHGSFKSEAADGLLLSGKQVDTVQRLYSRPDRRLPRGRAKQIINEILDHGRIEFLRVSKQRVPPATREPDGPGTLGASSSISSANRKAPTASVVFVSKPRLLAETGSHPESNPQHAAIEGSILRAKLDTAAPLLPRKSPPHERVVDNLSVRQQGRVNNNVNVDVHGALSLCKEYRRHKSSLFPQAEAKANRKPVSAQPEVGGSVATHFSAQPWRYEFNMEQAVAKRTAPIATSRKSKPDEDKMHGSLKKLLRDDRSGNTRPFLQHVESGLLNMKQVWKPPQHRDPVYIRVAAPSKQLS
jgi:hypothetical protein